MKAIYPFIVGQLMATPPWGRLAQPLGHNMQVIGCTVQIAGLLIGIWSIYLIIKRKNMF